MKQTIKPNGYIKNWNGCSYIIKIIMKNEERKEKKEKLILQMDGTFFLSSVSIWMYTIYDYIQINFIN